MMITRLLLSLVLLAALLSLVNGLPERSKVLSVGSVFVLCKRSLDVLYNDEVQGLSYDRSQPFKRQRKHVTKVFSEMGPVYQRRAYRMDVPSFWKLYGKIKPYMKGAGNLRPSKGSTKKHRNGAVNGIIPKSVRLACAIRYFAGGDPYDIMGVYGVCHTEVYNSVWMVVDAVNACDSLKISFPRDHAVQRQLAQAFSRKSDPGFGCCVGAIDGILIWIEKPNAKSCEDAESGQMAFFCGRKHKFGLNMQAVCDADRRFIDIDISMPGKTSDYLAFCCSDLYDDLEKGLLAPELCLFGDNAYVNTPYMATPYKAPKGTEDDYNFYHSQLRISIECAFGMLVNRWGILRRAIPATVGISKTTSMVGCLCRLHNFCVDERLQKKELPLPVPRTTEADEFNLQVEGAIPLERNQNGLNDSSPEQLLHGGEHFDSLPRNARRRMMNAIEAANKNKTLPRKLLHDMVVKKLFVRPTPKRWK